MKGAKKSKKRQRRQSTNLPVGKAAKIKGEDQGREDEVGPSGVHPMSGPHPPGQPEIRTQARRGQGERGGYEGINLAAHAQSGDLDIAPEEWISFFDGFSRQHEGWLAAISVVRGSEKLTEVTDCQVKGISTDHVDKKDKIYISIGRNGEHLTHPVTDPMRVTFKRDPGGAHEGLDIISGDRTVTSVRFRTAARPETLDGVIADPRYPHEEPVASSESHQPLPAGESRKQEKTVRIPIERTILEGSLIVPESARGVVLFAHGSGSGRHSPRNRYVAELLQEAGFATLLMDLLTDEEEALDMQTAAALRFDIDLLARRLIGTTWWLVDQSETSRLPIGYFGASTGAAAALVAAANVTDLVVAVVSRGGRPDLAGTVLQRVIAPTLFIVGGNDPQVLELNRAALAELSAARRLEVIPGATHLFEEQGALEEVAQLAKNWFELYLTGTSDRRQVA